MNSAFFCIPAHGHTNPTLAVVRELTARGHTVRYYTTEAFRAKIEAAGAVFVPFDAEAARPGMTTADDMPSMPTVLRTLTTYSITPERLSKVSW